jgi:hypothetical protein
MKYLAILALLGLVSAADLCPKDKEVECLTDINHGKKIYYLAFDVCDKAAKEKGKDQQADLDCMKYFVALEKDCWPCICTVAQQNGYKIKGCPQTLKSE